MAKATKASKIKHDADNRHDLGRKPNGKFWPPTTTYYPEYCDRLCELMSQGLTYVEVAKALQTSVKTMVQWRQNFPDFNDAYEMGANLAEAYYQSKMREHIVSYRVPNGPIETLDTKQVIYVLKSRFRQYDNPPPMTVNVTGGETETVKELMDTYTKDLYRSTI